MSIKKGEIKAFILILISFAVGLYFFPLLPEKVASHWNAQGQVNGYLPKFWGAFLMPVISLGLLLIFMLIPRIDPKKENIKKFRKYFDDFIILIFIFLLYLHILTILWNLNYAFNFTQALLPAFVVLFYFIGVLIAKAQPNWSIGIRNPWTLSNTVVWQKTHQLGGKLFKISALIGLIGLIFGNLAIWFMILPLLISVLIVTVYSYVIYKQETK